jgi:hypothetical protein
MFDGTADFPRRFIPMHGSKPIFLGVTPGRLDLRLDAQFL